MIDITATDMHATVVRAAEMTGDLIDVGPREGADTGAPWISSLRLYSDDKLKLGVWQSTPGGWNIENRRGTETMVILSGRVRITTQGEQPVEISAGDAFVLPHGWTGRWETLETVRKVYAHAL